MKHDAFLDAFAAARPALEAWRVRGEAELWRLLESRGAEVQLVSSRTKAADSLRRKLLRPDKSYGSLWDVTDLVGLRVVTAFEDTVDDVARALERHWRVDLAHSTDKRAFADHGRFGYRSLHYVCAAPDDAGLPSAFRFEVQIRTVLQHAWAEVEHDLGYKAHQTVPPAIHRRFSRIASLLELADQEFSSIRAELRRYQDAVRDEVQHPARPLPIDVVSLAALVDTAAVGDLDARLAAALGLPVADTHFFPEYLITLLRHAGLSTTAAVQAAVARHSDRAAAVVGPYVDFAAQAFQLDVTALPAFERGYSLFFVAHVALLSRDELSLGRVARLAQTYRALDFPDDEAAAHRVAVGIAAALLPLLEERLDERLEPQLDEKPTTERP